MARWSLCCSAFLALFSLAFAATVDNNNNVQQQFQPEQEIAAQTSATQFPQPSIPQFETLTPLKTASVCPAANDLDLCKKAALRIMAGECPELLPAPIAKVITSIKNSTMSKPQPDPELPAATPSGQGSKSSHQQQQQQQQQQATPSTGNVRPKRQASQNVAITLGAAINKAFDKDYYGALNTLAQLDYHQILQTKLFQESQLVSSWLPSTKKYLMDSADAALDTASSSVGHLCNVIPSSYEEVDFSWAKQFACNVQKAIIFQKQQIHHELS